MRVVFAAAEADPVVKVGGLGDIGLALPKALARLGHQVRVIVPRYRELPRNTPLWMTTIGIGAFRADVEISPHSRFGSVDYLTVGFAGDSMRFEAPSGYAGENVVPFALVSQAVARLAADPDVGADVLHCNDWQFAHACAYLAAASRRPARILTIHNLAYQGILGADLRSAMSYGGQPNEPSLLAQGIRCADAITTVSEHYREETLQGKSGALLRERRTAYHGITNGLDYEVFDPSADRYIPYPYDVQDLYGKVHNKAELQRVSGLAVTADVPVVSFVARLTRQKGPALLLDAIPALVALGLQVVAVGRGPEFEREFEAASNRNPTVAFHADASEPMARLAYAGSDIFVAPSKFEPFGLAPLIALRYGCVPVVRATGGMLDTIGASRLGITFHRYRVRDFVNAVAAAVDLFDRPNELHRFQSRAMAARFSWDDSARRYEQLYRAVTCTS